MDVVSECPFCEFPLAPASESPVCPNCERDLSALPLEETAEGHHESDLSSPSRRNNRRIHLVESTDERLILFIHSGGEGAAYMGCGTLGFLLVLSGISIAVALIPRGGGAVFVIHAMLGLFWAIWLTTVWEWLKRKFVRTLLLVEQTQAVIQRAAFGRKKRRRYLLDERSFAEFRQIDDETNAPVNPLNETDFDLQATTSVVMHGKTANFHFGANLSETEKLWLANRINRFLGRSMPSLTEKQPDRILPLEPEAIPRDSPIQIDQAMPDRLAFHLPAFPDRRGAKILVFMLSCFWLLITSIATHAVLTIIPLVLPMPKWVEILLIGLGTAIGIAPFLIGLFGLQGTIHIFINQTHLYCTWKLGAWKSRKSETLADLLELRVSSEPYLLPGILSRKSSSISESSEDFSWRLSEEFKCLAIGDEVIAILSAFHSEEITLQVAGLVQYQFDLMEVTLSDQTTEDSPDEPRPLARALPHPMPRRGFRKNQT